MKTANPRTLRREGEGRKGAWRYVPTPCTGSPALLTGCRPVLRNVHAAGNFFLPVRMKNMWEEGTWQVTSSHQLCCRLPVQPNPSVPQFPQESTMSDGVDPIPSSPCAPWCYSLTFIIAWEIWKPSENHGNPNTSAFSCTFWLFSYSSLKLKPLHMQ